MNKLRALVTDDHAYLRKLISNILVSCDYEITEAADGQEAVNIFLKEQDQQFDLITMDYQMPRLNGGEAIQRIREKNKKVPIIAITASITLMRPQTEIHSPIYYLSKPFDPDALREIIESIKSK